MNIQEATEILHNRGFMLETKGAKTLNKAAKAADDEFYTYYKDVEKEMKNYNFSGKTVYCCCDDPEWSNVYKYFEDNFDKLGLNGLISSHYILPGDNETYWTEFKDGERIKHPLAGNGDCTSAECQKLADMADVIVTNPPFSIFGDIATTYANKPFIMLCTPLKMVSNRKVRKMYMEKKIRYGYTTASKFYRPDGGEDKHVYTIWYTNLKVNKNYPGINIVPMDDSFERFDNSDVIIATYKAVPDTDELIGLPVSTLVRVDPNNLPFEIVDVDDNLYVNGKQQFSRLVVKLK